MDIDTDGDGGTHQAVNDGVSSDRINAVILHTMNQLSASEQHAKTLERRRINYTLIPCEDLSWFQEVNVDRLGEVHVIVDTSMFAILMKDGDLDKSAKKVFQEIEKSRKKIYAVDNFPEDFDELFHKLPRNARRRWEDSRDLEIKRYGKKIYVVDNSPEDMDELFHKLPRNARQRSEDSGDLGAQSTGMTGGEARESVVVGTHNGQQTVVYGNFYNFQTEKKYEIMGKEVHEGESIVLGVQQSQPVDPNMNNLQISIQHDGSESENDKMLTKVSKNIDRLLNNHVSKVNVEMGSVIITLTVEKSLIMTDEWINDQLKIIFHEILASFIADGIKFCVTVERYITLSREEMLKLCKSLTQEINP